MALEMGSTLGHYDEKYSVVKDPAGTWRILDRWHPSLRIASPDDDIPDDSEAVLLIPDGAFVALIKEATQLGYLENAVVSRSRPVDTDELLALRIERDTLKIECATLSAELRIQKEKKPQSEPFQLKNKIVDSLLKLAVSEDISSLE